MYIFSNKIFIINRLKACYFWFRISIVDPYSLRIQEEEDEKTIFKVLW